MTALKSIDQASINGRDSHAGTAGSARKGTATPSQRTKTMNARRAGSALALDLRGLDRWHETGHPIAKSLARMLRRLLTAKSER